jgi:hypothetical protein
VFEHIEQRLASAVGRGPCGLSLWRHKWPPSMRSGHDSQLTALCISAPLAEERSIDQSGFP